jgi:hypothetical protein
MERKIISIFFHSYEGYETFHPPTVGSWGGFQNSKQKAMSGNEIEDTRYQK